MDNRMVEQLRKDEQKIRKKIEELRSSIEKELSAAESDLAHILGAIGYYERLQREDKEIVSLVHETPEPKLRGLTHKQAVVAIAKQNGGIVRSSQAKKLMIRAGIMADTKNSNRMVHNAIKASKLFDPISPGKYRLRSFAAPVADGPLATAADLERIVN